MTFEEVMIDCCHLFLKNCDLSDEKITNMSFDELLFSAYSILFRMIPKVEYEIYISKELEEQLNTLPEDYVKGIELIYKELSQGEDVNYRLSKRACDPDPSKTDYLLSEWNIYHLHLGLEREEGSNFAKRTKLLLYLVLHRNSAYFIKCYPHEFEKLEMIKIIENNWDFLLKSREINGAISLSYNPSEKDIKELRRVNVNSAIQSEKVYAPNFGVATDGTPVVVTLSVDKTIKISKEIKKKTNLIFKKAEFCFFINIYKYGLQLYTDKGTYNIPFLFPLP